MRFKFEVREPPRLRSQSFFLCVQRPTPKAHRSTLNNLLGVEQPLSETHWWKQLFGGNALCAHGEAAGSINQRQAAISSIAIRGH